MKGPLPGLPGGAAIPWDGKRNPYAIGFQHNPAMDCYEVVIHIGAFATAAEAEMATHYLAPHIPELLGGTLAPVQQEAPQ